MTVAANKITVKLTALEKELLINAMIARLRAMPAEGYGVEHMKRWCERIDELEGNQ